MVATQAPQYKQLLKVYNSATGQLDKNGDVIEIDEALAGVFGFKLIPVKPEKALGFHINKYQTGVRNSTKEFTGGPEGTLKPMKSMEEVIERYFVANQIRFNAHKNMKTHIRNAKKLGLSDDKIFEIFQKRGYKKDYIYLEDGAFDPYYPSKGIQLKFEEIATDTGLTNPFEEAAPIIDKMYDAFNEKSLTDPTFEFKLEDFLPDTDPEGQSALPPTAMPNAQVIQSAAMQQVGASGTMNQGLTPTENALLSDEEKQIKLRSRGLA